MLSAPPVNHTNTMLPELLNIDSHWLISALLVIPTSQFSWLVVRISQDLYHVLAHYNLPGLKWLHKWHNKYHHYPYRDNYYLRVSPEELCQAHLYNEIPEAIFMVIANLLFLWVLKQLNYSDWWCFLYGVYLTIRSHLVPATRIYLGNFKLYLNLATMHIPQTFTEAPGRWKVNAAFHLRHHDDDPNAYFCAHYPWLDIFLGTAYSFRNKTFSITYAEFNQHTAKQLQDALPVIESRKSLETK